MASTNTNTNNNHSASTSPNQSTSTSGGSALGSGIVAPPPESTKDLSPADAPATTGESGGIHIPAFPDMDLASLAMPSNVATIAEKTGLDVQFSVPSKTFFRTRAGWILGTPTAPFIVVRIDQDTTKMHTEKFRCVHPSIVTHLDPADYQRVVLHGAVTIGGTYHLIPVRVDGDDGWATAARSAVAEAQVGWIRLVPKARGYDIRYGSPENAPTPAWPANVTFDTFAKLGLKDRMITDLNHPVIRGLQGRW